MNAEELKLILEEGEGYRIEFKEALSGIDREMVAFANASGGRLFIGGSDKKAVCGISIDNKLKSQVQDIANQCQPPVKILIEDYNSILIIHVREGDDKPYKCSSGFYLRVGPNAQKLNRNEILEFIKSEGKVRFDELLCTRFNYPKQFDGKKLNDFLNLSAITPPRDKTLALVNLGAAEKQEGKTVFNNLGALFFSKNLDDIYHHTMVTCALFAGTEKADVQDRRDFNEDILSSIDRGMIFLKQYIPVRYEMTGMPQRREIPEIPYDALHRAGYIEKMGTGVTKMRKLMRDAGLLPPLFESGYFFTATFRRSGTKGSCRKQPPAKERNEGVNEGVNLLHAFICDHPGKRTSEISKVLNVPQKTIERWIHKLKAEQKIIFVGSPKTGGYEKKEAIV